MDGLITPPTAVEIRSLKIKQKFPFYFAFLPPSHLVYSLQFSCFPFFPCYASRVPRCPTETLTLTPTALPFSAQLKPNSTQLNPTLPNFTQLGRKFAVTHLTLSRMVDGCNQLPALCEETEPNVTRIQADDEHVIKLMVNGQLIIAMGLCSIVLGYAP